MAASESERVTYVDDSSAGLGRNEAKFFRAWGSDLESPFFGEEECKRTDVCMLLMTDVMVGNGVRRDVVHHGQSASRGTVVAVRVLEALLACETQAGG